MQALISHDALEKAKQVEYEDYTSTSNNYDQTRYAVGLQEMLSLIKERAPSFKSYLDVGCGTGNYLLPIAELFEEAVGLDLNEGMLAQCANKLKGTELSKKLTLKQGLAQELPAEDGSIDVVTACQTIHHYGSDENRQLFFNEAYRVLKPGGQLIVQHSTQEQNKSFWCYYFSERVLKECTRLFNTSEDMKQFGTKAGFTFEKEMPQFVPLMQEKAYYNPEVFLTKEGRDQDSAWAFYSPEELEGAIEKLRTLVEANTFEEWLKTHGGENSKLHGWSSHFVYSKK